MIPIKFQYGTAAEFAKLKNKDPNTLYFISDDRKIYKGDAAYGTDSYKKVTDFPTEPETGTLYVNIATGEAKFYDGEEYIPVVKPVSAAIGATPSPDKLVTEKAVTDYLAGRLQDMEVGQMDARVTANANKIAEVDEKATTTQTKVDENTTKISTLETEVADTKTTVVSTEVEVSNIKTRLTAVESSTTTNAANVAANATAIEANVTKIFDVETDITEINSKFPAIEEKAGDAEVKATAAEVKAGDALKSIDSLQESVDLLMDGKADVATTLAGYGITDAYTQEETNAAITAAIGTADHLKREIVEELPLPSKGDTNTIYMVPIEDGGGDQQYAEFMLINEAFERIGSSAVELTNYVTKNNLSETVAMLTELSHSAAKEAYDDAVYFTVTSVSGLATKEQGEKAETALQMADITCGTTNGTIHVRNKEVCVAGLGTAAYTDLEDLATVAGVNAAKAAADEAKTIAAEAKAIAQDAVSANGMTEAQVEAIVNRILADYNINRVTSISVNDDDSLTYTYDDGQ